MVPNLGMTHSVSALPTESKVPTSEVAVVSSDLTSNIDPSFTTPYLSKDLSPVAVGAAAGGALRLAQSLSAPPRSLRRASSLHVESTHVEGSFIMVDYTA